MNDPNPHHSLASCHHDLVAAHLEFPKPLPQISCFPCQLLQCDVYPSQSCPAVDWAQQYWDNAISGVVAQVYTYKYTLIYLR